MHSTLLRLDQMTIGMPPFLKCMCSSYLPSKNFHICFLFLFHILECTCMCARMVCAMMLCVFSVITKVKLPTDDVCGICLLLSVSEMHLLAVAIYDKLNVSCHDNIIYFRQICYPDCHAILSKSQIFLV